jgi:hypothetical protein
MTMKRSIQLNLIWNGLEWTKEYKVTENRDVENELTVKFSINKERGKISEEISVPNFWSVIKKLSVSRKHLIIVLIGEDKTIMRPYLSFIGEELAVLGDALFVGPLLFYLPELKICVSDSRDQVRYTDS